MSAHRGQVSPRRRVGLAILLGLCLFGIGEGVFHGVDPALQNLAGAFTPPGAEHWLGTDQFGRSMLARTGAAVRLSLWLSALCVLTSVSLGVCLGVLAAWRGGLVDRALSLLVNLLLALPGLVLILLFAALAPGSFVMLYAAISLVLWVEYFRVSRAVTGAVVRSSAMQASQMLGFGRLYCFHRHIWPQVMPAVLTQAAFGAANAILALAALGFVSVGLRPPTAELGLMLVELFPYYSDAPWALAQPVAVIFLIVLGCYLLAEDDR